MDQTPDVCSAWLCPGWFASAGWVGTPVALGSSHKHSVLLGSPSTRGGPGAEQKDDSAAHSSRSLLRVPLPSGGWALGRWLSVPFRGGVLRPRVQPHSKGPPVFPIVLLYVSAKAGQGKNENWVWAGGPGQPRSRGLPGGGSNQALKW